MRRDIRRGITLVELLVVVALAGIMMALLLPAVYSAQTAARQASCMQNLRQIGLALFNHQSVNDVLPMSQVRGTGRGSGHSAFSAILPYIEQTALYNGYNFDLENYAVDNQTVVRSRVSTFLCPENPDVENIDARDVRFPDSRSSLALAWCKADLD
jgi:prepilin-type N-terminal cleavage/methylation domain-containing protein